MLLVNKTKSKIDTQEVFNLNESLRTRYGAIELVKIVQNYIHDKDFSVLVSIRLLRLLDKHIKKLESVMDSFQIKLPRRPPKSVRTPANSEAFNDNFIGGLILKNLEQNVSDHFIMVRSSLTNDNIRDMFAKFLFDELDVLNDMVKYMKLKGWLNLPPIYPDNPSGVNEHIDASEAFHLWDHLGARYDAVEITQIFQNFAHDPDFRLLMTNGLQNILERQINILEKELNHFGITLPERPPKSFNVSLTVNIMDDQLMFRRIFTNQQFMFDLHMTALKQCKTNDRLRKLYKSFLTEELSIFNDMAKYGILKGWTRPIPMYKTN